MVEYSVIFAALEYQHCWANLSPSSTEMTSNIFSDKFSKIFMSERKQILVLLVVTLTLKLALGLYFSYLAGCAYPQSKVGIIAITGGDTFSYLEPIDNFINEGRYYFWNGSQNVFAGRMPYYGAPYFLLRLLFNQSTAYDIYAIIQIFFDALATTFFARLCFKLLPVNIAFSVGYVLYFCSFNLTVLNIRLLPESLSLSFFILFIYFYHCYWEKRNIRDALRSAIFLSLITTLKPYFFIFYPLVFIGVWLVVQVPRKRVYHLFERLKIIALFGLPLIILLTPWIVRNMFVMEKFIPAQENIWAGYNYSKSHIAFTKFAGAWGGGSVPWDQTDAGCYFLIEGKNSCDFFIPDYALADDDSRNQIENVRKKFIRLQSNYSPELDDEVASEFRRLTDIYRQEQPFRYYIGAKFIFLKKLFWHTNNYNLPIHPSFRCFKSAQLIFKVIQFVIYILALTLGVFGLLKLAVERKISILFITVPLFLILFYLELRTSEQRYVSQVIPLLLIGVTVFLGRWTSHFKLIL